MTESYRVGRRRYVSLDAAIGTALRSPRPVRIEQLVGSRVVARVSYDPSTGAAQIVRRDPSGLDVSLVGSVRRAASDAAGQCSRGGEGSKVEP